MKDQKQTFQGIRKDKIRHDRLRTDIFGYKKIQNKT